MDKLERFAQSYQKSIRKHGRARGTLKINSESSVSESECLQLSG